MKASHILLNHFSQRYPKFPKLNLPTDPSSSNTVISISFDFMSIKIGDMWKMAHYMEPLSMLFDEAEPEEGDSTTEAVENDLNPSVDQPSTGAGGNANAGSGGGGGKKGKGKQNGQSNNSKKTTDKSKKGPIEATQSKAAAAADAQSKRSQKKARRYAAEEEEGNAPCQQREKSPTEEMPEAKRSKHEPALKVEGTTSAA